MKLQQLEDWIEQAKTAGANWLEIRRAGKFGRAGEMMTRINLDVDLDHLLERLEDDAESRGLGSAVFYLNATDDKQKSIAKDTVKVAPGTRDDQVKESTDLQAMMKAQASHVDRLVAQNQFLLDFTTKNMQHAMDKAAMIAERVTERMVEQDKAWASLVTETLEMAQMKLERQQSAQESEERRTMIHTALERGMPLVSMIVTEAMKTGKGAKIAGLLETLRPEQVMAIYESLDPEQRIAFEKIISEEKPKELEQKPRPEAVQ